MRSATLRTGLLRRPAPRPMTATCPPCARQSRRAMRHASASGRMPGFLASLPPHLIRALASDWLHNARTDQLPPCPSRGDWTTWAVIGGRGSGKTRTGGRMGAGAGHGRPRLLRPGGGPHRPHRRRPMPTCAT